MSAPRATTAGRAYLDLRNLARANQLRRYLQGRDAKPGELLALARQLRIGTVMAEMLEAMLA